MDHSHHPRAPDPPFWRSKGGIALIMLALIGLFYVAREHYGHFSQILPYLILLLCPLMHVFGHNHGGHSHSSEQVARDEEGKSHGKSPKPE